MKKKRTRIAAFCLAAMLFLSACGDRSDIDPSAEESVETPSVIIISPPVHEPEPEPSPTPAPAPTPVPVVPVITKQPLAQTVSECGSCVFETEYKNADTAAWHFLSPDGRRDLTYDQIQTVFPALQVIDGMYSTMYLKNIPWEADGWQVYCRYSNDRGHTDTDHAVITVIRYSPDVSGMDLRYELPMIAKDPEPCTVEEGGTCSFEAAYVNAIWASWYFVSPDGSKKVRYTKMDQIFPDMRIIDGMYSAVTLENVPLEADGWQVYCRYTNKKGYTDTASVQLTVLPKEAPQEAPEGEA